MEVSGQHHSPNAFTTGKKPQNAQNWSQGGSSQSRSGHFAEDKKVLAPEDNRRGLPWLPSSTTNNLDRLRYPPEFYEYLAYRTVPLL